MSERGAKRHVKLSIIQRRKDLEGRSAEDAIYTHQLGDRITELAGKLVDQSGDKTQSKKDLAKKIRNILPFVIEIPRRQQEIADDLNNSMVWQYGRLISVNGEDIAHCEKELDTLRDYVQRYGLDSEETKAQARIVADMLNARHRDDLSVMPMQTVVSEGALGYFSDLFNTTDIRHRGGRAIPEMNTDELRGWVDDIEYLRNCLQKISQAGNIENFDQIRDQLLDDMNARADRVVAEFNQNHANEIANGGREMTRGDLLDIIWLSKAKLKQETSALGVQEITGSDLLAVAQLTTQRLLPEDIDFDRSQLQEIIDDIGDWYANWFMDLENAGMRPSTVGRVTNYVNHIWDRESPGLGKVLDENFQRTRSANMRNREIPTLMTGLSVGLTPKTTDIVDMMAYYSRHNAEALANKTLIEKLHGVMVGLPDKDGEIIASVPMLTREAPEYARDRYEHYEVPGIGDLWVLDIASKRFANVFGPLHMAGEKTASQKAWAAYDVTTSTAKKIELSFSGFHMGALLEVYFAQMSSQHFADGFTTFMKYMVTDCIKKGTLPTFANPEVYKDAARHLVKLGANDDYAASEVLVLTEKFKKFLVGVEEQMKEKGINKNIAAASVKPAELVASMLDFCNKGMDAILWSYLHDGLKMCAYDIYARNIRKKGAKEGWDEEKIDQMLDEAGQYVNDMFGGQYWELINISPAQLKAMQRLLLSPDWLISTNRHFFANFGFGSLYSDEDYWDYAKNNWMGLKRLLPKKYRSEKDDFRAFRSKNSKLCYIIGVGLIINSLMNAWNMANRKKDVEEQEKIAREKGTMSPYELAYPDGMDWLDYTMLGNTMEKKTHLFWGRNEDGSENYLRWGKQFREFPELFENEKGEADFPFPIMNRLLSKANPFASFAFESLMYASPHRQTYWDKKLIQEHGLHFGYLIKLARKFKPFSFSSKDKERSWVNFVFPTGKGFSFYKAKDYLKDFIDNEDWEGVREVYKACVRNNIDFDNVYRAVNGIIEAEEREANYEGVTTQQDAIERFDGTNSLTERKKLQGMIKKYLYKDNTPQLLQGEAVQKAIDLIKGEDVPKAANDIYLQSITGEDAKEDAAFWWFYSELNKRNKEVTNFERSGDTGAASTSRQHWSNYLKAFGEVNDARLFINEQKKLLEGVTNGKNVDVGAIIERIRGRRKKVMEKFKQLYQSTVPYDYLTGE